jgi:hypothetical protein
MFLVSLVLSVHHLYQRHWLSERLLFLLATLQGLYSRTLSYAFKQEPLSANASFDNAYKGGVTIDTNGATTVTCEVGAWGNSGVWDNTPIVQFFLHSLPVLVMYRHLKVREQQ